MNYFVSSGFREHEGGVNTNHRPVTGGLRWWAPEAGAGVGGGRRRPERVWVVVVQAAGAMPRTLRAVGTSDEGVTGQCSGETGGLTHRDREGSL